MLDVIQLRVLAAVAEHGSVTAAARALHYAQPSVSHQLRRLEAETGAQLVQRVGRGIRLTETGTLLAARAVEILGRLEAASAEVATQVGLDSGRVRVAAFSSALVSLVPDAAAALARKHPRLEIEMVDAHPPEALAMLRSGQVDVALVFRYDTAESEEDGVRLLHLRDDITYLLSGDDRDQLADHRDSRWVGGCERCRAHLIELCERAGFTPRLAYATDDMVVTQAVVGAGMGVAVLPGLALEAHRRPDINAYEVPGSTRHIYAATYGNPPDPPPTAALLAALRGLLPL
jgi:DNA-binding transcriptional LysR family regulator